MSAFSMDLRERNVAACAAGASQTSAPQRFGVCSKTVQRYVARAARGELAPLPLPGPAFRVRPEQEAAFLSMMREQSDWTVEALCVELEKRSGVLLPRSTLHDAFAAMCFDVGQIGRNFGFDVANIGGAMMAASLLLSLFLHIRSWWIRPRRRASLRLGARLISESMLGFFIAASVLYALVAFGFLPLAYRYERNFEQAMKRGEAQIARASLGLK